MRIELLEILIRTTGALSLAVAVILALRLPARRWLCAQTAYLLWAAAWADQIGAAGAGRSRRGSPCHPLSPGGPGARQTVRYRRIGSCPAGWGIGDQRRPGAELGRNALAG